MRKIVLLLAAVLLLAGCSSLALFIKKCADSPKESVLALFDALQSTAAVSTDLERPPDFFDIKAIMRIAPDPRRLISSLGGGDPKKGWEELKFLRTLTLFHSPSGLEFQEYAMSIEYIRPVESHSESLVRYRVVLKRTDILFDMSDQGDFREVRKSYQRTFFAEFTSGGYCIAGITPIGRWEEANESR